MQALEILRELIHDRVAPGAINFNSSISDNGSRHAIKQALKLSREMRQTRTRDHACETVGRVNSH